LNIEDLKTQTENGQNWLTEAGSYSLTLPSNAFPNMDISEMPEPVVFKRQRVQSESDLS
jgi:hypothetical protein